MHAHALMPARMNALSRAHDTLARETRHVICCIAAARAKQCYFRCADERQRREASSAREESIENSSISISCYIMI